MCNLSRGRSRFARDTRLLKCERFTSDAQLVSVVVDWSLTLNFKSWPHVFGLLVTTDCLCLSSSPSHMDAVHDFAWHWTAEHSIVNSGRLTLEINCWLWSTYHWHRTTESGQLTLDSKLLTVVDLKLTPHCWQWSTNLDSKLPTVVDLPW